MPSKKALRYALEKISTIPFEIIAPQHGSIITDRQLQQYVFSKLAALEAVGVDGMVGDNHHFNFNGLKQRTD